MVSPNAKLSTMTPHDLKLKLATICSHRDTGVPVPILTEMLYDTMKKVNPETTRGSIKKVLDENLTLLQTAKKLYSMSSPDEVK